MAEQFGVGTQVVMALPFLPNAECPQAGEIITSVRDLIIDPVYDPVTDEPLPDADGGTFRAATLYRWLSGGIRELTRRTNWMVEDWTAVPQTTRQQVVGLDRRFVNVDGAFCNQYRLLHLDELHTIYPSYAVAQPLWFSWHSRTDQLTLSLWPAPDRQDPQANLMVSLAPTTVDIALSTTAGFLPFGWVRMGDELVQYSEVWRDPGPPVTQGLRVARRGVGGTAAAQHFAGTPVTHCGVWVKGLRVPSPVRRSTDCVEIPLAYQQILETYVLAKVRESEQDRGAAQSLMQEFVAMTNDILNDPKWQQPPFPVQARAYGVSEVGGLSFGRLVVP
jgi:hypothetical protein